MRRIMWDPSAYTDVDEDEYTRGLEEPGGNHAVFELYRATETDADQNRPQFAVPLECPVLAVGGRAYLAAEPGEQMAQVAMNVAPVVIEQAGAQQPVGGTRRTRALLPRFLRDRERMTVQRRLYRRAGDSHRVTSIRSPTTVDGLPLHAQPYTPAHPCLPAHLRPSRPAWANSSVSPRLRAGRLPDCLLFWPPCPAAGGVAIRWCSSWPWPHVRSWPAPARSLRSRSGPLTPRPTC